MNAQVTPTRRRWAMLGVIYPGEPRWKNLPGVEYPKEGPSIITEDVPAEEEARLFLAKTGTTLADIREHRRTNAICVVRRNLIAHLAGKGHSARSIGRVLHRDHSGILYNMPGGRRKDYVKRRR